MRPSAESWDLDIAGLEGWTALRGGRPDLAPEPWTWTDDQGTFARPIPGTPERVLLCAEGVVSALVDLGDRSILLHDIGDDAMAGHWLTDQVAPRLLGHLGRLVVHGAAVLAQGGRVVLVIGPSGQGKSTLSAFLHQSGWPLLGDDATVLRPTPKDVMARSVYPRLKLRHDSWRRLYPSAPLPPTPKGWKVDVEVSGTGPAGSELPLASVFVLGLPGDAGAVEIGRLPPARACMALVEQSFALDPTDPARVAARLKQAAEVAARVPAYSLTYPRDYDRLPEVHATLFAAVERLADRAVPP